MLFNIWNPTRTAHDEVTFDITQANAPSVGTGDPDWIAACLDAISVSVPASEWSVHATRCYFYSDYPDEAEWSDRWPKTWIVQVTLDGAAPDEFDRPDGIAYEISQYDETWEYDDFDPDHDRTALLLVLVEGRREDARTVRDELESALPADHEIERARIDTVDTGLHQVRIFVRNELFPDQTNSLEAALRQVKDQGHAVNRYDLLDF